MNLSSSEDPMIVARVVLTQCQRVTDGRTDRQTDGRIYDSIASQAMLTRCKNAVQTITILNDTLLDNEWH